MHRIIWRSFGCGLLFWLGAGIAIAGDAPIAFYSSLPLKVYLRGDGEIPDRLLGSTPAPIKKPIVIATHSFWYVRPLGPLTPKVLAHLVKEVQTFHISGLDLSGHAELTDAQLPALQLLDQLQMLDLSQTSISDQGIASLQAFKKLAVLIAPETLSDQGLNAVAALPHLTELTLDRTHVTNRGLPVLSQLPALERLDISATPITDKGMDALLQIPSLHRLILNSLITDAGAGILKTLPSLTEIDISQTQIGSEGMKALAALPHLRTLYAGKEFNNAAAKNLAQSPSLRTLDLTRSAITDEGVKELRRLKSLQELALSQTAVGNACVADLAKMPNLRMLELSDTGVTSAGLTPLSASPHLEIISLSWKELSREDLQGLAHIARLQSIVLNGVPLSSVIMAKLRRLGGLEVPTSRPLPMPLLAKPVPAPVDTAFVPKRIAPPPPPERPVTPHLAQPLPHDLTPTPQIAEPIDVAQIRPIQPPEVFVKHSKNTIGQAMWAVPGTAPDIVPANTHEAQARGPAKNEAEHLLKTIFVESNPSRGGGFSNLAELKQLRFAEVKSKVSDIQLDPKQAEIKEQEDRPENSLGDLSFTAKRSK